MKWPSSLTIIRHGQSQYNILRDIKKKDPEYQKFVREFDRDHLSKQAQELAQIIRARYSGNMSDYDTPLTDEGRKQSQKVGLNILKHIPMPDVIFVSPYVRTQQTLDEMLQSMPKDFRVPVVVEDRIREQEHGLSSLYYDWRVFHTIHPEQKSLHDLQGEYWYQYPQGESVSMVRERIRSMLTMLIREYSEKHVWMVSHHLTKLSIRANLERLSPEEFIRIDEKEKPINCGITHYEGNPDVGTNGRLELTKYNLKLY